ncbi:MAG: hypothetical protein KKD39_05325, partial [Candidatus Altiarchaeota archaeon]|nr:hypothetical protein [Candidatus Altiarchaeota archaeon]
MARGGQLRGAQPQAQTGAEAQGDEMPEPIGVSRREQKRSGATLRWIAIGLVSWQVGSSVVDWPTKTGPFGWVSDKVGLTAAVTSSYREKTETKEQREARLKEEAAIQKAEAEAERIAKLPPEERQKAMEAAEKAEAERRKATEAQRKAQEEARAKQIQQFVNALTAKRWASHPSKPDEAGYHLTDLGLQINPDGTFVSGAYTHESPQHGPGTLMPDPTHPGIYLDGGSRPTLDVLDSHTWRGRHYGGSVRIVLNPDGSMTMRFISTDSNVWNHTLIPVGGTTPTPGTSAPEVAPEGGVEEPDGGVREGRGRPSAPEDVRGRRRGPQERHVLKPIKEADELIRRMRGARDDTARLAIYDRALQTLETANTG